MASQVSSARKRFRLSERSLPLMVTASVTLGVLVTAAVYWLIPKVAIVDPSKGMTAANRFTAAFATATAVGAIVALVVSLRRQDLSEWESIATDRRDARDQANARASQFTERFAAAAAQLGRTSAAERIAGVYAMAALADDYEDKRQQCVDVLCGYLRLPWDPETDSTESVTREQCYTLDDGRTITERVTPAHTPHDREVRNTTVSVLRAHLVDPDDPAAWCRLDFDFRGALLYNVSFREATFSGAITRFDDATFMGAYTSFYRATFGGAQTLFSRTAFRGENTWFVRATFNGETWFDGATFSAETTSFDGATFSGAETRFEGATMGGVPFDPRNSEPD